MEYERIHRPQKGGGLSPAKLRSMLMGVDKKRREAQEVDSSCSLRSQVSGIDDAESCKDVDVVREHVECSTSTTVDSEITVDRKLNGQSVASSGIRLDGQFEAEYDSGRDNMSVTSSTFEFQKTERGPQRVPAARFSKPAPSKWDDAQKWIASPNSNRPRTEHSHNVQGARKTNNLSHGVRKPATKVVSEVPDGKSVAFEEPETKMIDSSADNNGTAGQRLMTWQSDPYQLISLHGKTADMIEKSVGEPLARSVSMKDMGTEMTPIASQEPSRSGTPVKVTSPMLSPTSSRTSTPKRTHPSEANAELQICCLDVQGKERSEKEMQMKTRKEIMELGMQLGKMNITSWACKEEENTPAAGSLKTVTGEQQVPENVVETRAEAWEEAEKARYMGRFEREEMKIQAWENHQKAKSEAEMKKIEVEVERMKAKAQDKLMSKLAAVRHKAEEKRAAAEAKMHKQAAKSEQQAEYIRKTGRIPSKSSWWSCCC